MNVQDLQTPALIVDGRRLEENLATMARALPGDRLRPHVKAHKSTALAKRQRAHGHELFCAATIREIEGMARAGLGEDLLLANEVADATRLGVVARSGARVTLAVDSAETIEAAWRGGVSEVLIDVNVGLPRCGCRPQEAGQLAERARKVGLIVRGVMGYEGHIVGQADRVSREEGCFESMEKLLVAHEQVGGDLISAGGTGTYECNRWATEIQAGSYALMDTAYAKLELPFLQAFYLLSTVISVSSKFAVADAGLKALGMDHGNPTIPGARLLFCSDEHVTYAPGHPEGENSAASLSVDWQSSSAPRVGEKICLIPAHVDPTIAYHERAYVVEGDRVVDEWIIDLRGW